MPNDRKTSWELLVAVGGLAASLLGNWFQYQSLEATRADFSQKQVEFDERLRQAHLREERWTQKRSDLQNRMTELDEQIATAEFEERRSASGIVFAPAEQKTIAVEMLNQARARKTALLAEKSKLQDKIDALTVE